MTTPLLELLKYAINARCIDGREDYAVRAGFGGLSYCREVAERTFAMGIRPTSSRSDVQQSVRG